MENAFLHFMDVQSHISHAVIYHITVYIVHQVLSCPPPLPPPGCPPQQVSAHGRWDPVDRVWSALYIPGAQLGVPPPPPTNPSLYSR